MHPVGAIAGEGEDVRKGEQTMNELPTDTRELICYAQGAVSMMFDGQPKDLICALANRLDLLTRDINLFDDQGWRTVLVQPIETSE